MPPDLSGDTVELSFGGAVAGICCSKPMAELLYLFRHWAVSMHCDGVSWDNLNLTQALTGRLLSLSGVAVTLTPSQVRPEQYLQLVDLIEHGSTSSCVLALIP